MTDATANEFEQQRPFLTGIAYRMLGSFADAQDIVQDAFLRWHGRAKGEAANPRAFLATIVTRLCLDRLRSARHRRETYVGSWLPEPIVAGLATDDEPPDVALDAPMALMLALERLSPLERAVFILHDLIEMELAEVAAAIEREPATARQLLVRARTHVGETRQRYPVDVEEGRRVAVAFFEAIRSGKVEPLRDLLAAAAVMRSDGGGKVLASLNPIEGGDHIFRFFEGVTSKHRPNVMLWSGVQSINGLPGYVSVDAAGNLQTTAFEIEDGRITAIYIVRNPDKLTHIERPGAAAVPA